LIKRPFLQSGLVFWYNCCAFIASLRGNDYLRGPSKLMKKLITLILGAIILGSCGKTIEKVGEDLVIKAMTDGQWKITKFTQNGNDITSSFSSYKFQYYSNKTVDAILNGVKERTGTWDGDAVTMTTSASFPGAPDPIALINGSWNITKNSWTYVEAKQTNGAEVKTLRLDKQ